MATGYDAVQAEVAACLQHYAGMLRLPAHVTAYAAAIAPAAWDAFPAGSKFRGVKIFAEVITFHAMKAAGVPFDQAAFRAASLLGDAPMNRRRWLLGYQRYLPPALRVACREPGPEAWFDRMPPGPLVAAARAIDDAAGWRLAGTRPRIRAAACVVAARKRLGPVPEGSPGVAETVEAIGVGLATAYNAAVRVGLIDPPSKIRHGRVAATVA
ncbi:MAG: hypothetical protein Q6373_008025 [Candidatus Sigynarchaeota archaeon]